MAELKDGEHVEVEGSTGWYTIARDGDVYSCTCPAWRHQRLAIEMRTCKHIRAFLGDYDAVTYQPLGDVPTVEEEEDVRKKREAILEECLEKYVVFYDKFEELTGLRLPEHLACFAGFFLALSKEEKEWIGAGASLNGVARWFEDGLSDGTKGEDLRLRDRVATDPVELFPIFDLGSEGRYGLFYDDTKELPTGIGYRTKTKTKKGATVDPRAAVTLLEPTLLRSLYAQRRYYGIGEVEGDELPANEQIRNTVMAWLGAVARREAKTARSHISPNRGGAINGGPTPFIHGWKIPPDLDEWSNQHDRSVAYDKRDARVGDWIAQALQDLRDGSPGRALLIGRELHWFAAEEWRASACELLIRGYVALGRRPLADLVQAHYREFYPKTPVFELPRAHPIVLAASNGDMSGLTEAIGALAAEDGERPTATDIGEALASATSVEAINALLDLDATQTDSALWRRLTDLAKGQSKAIVRALLTRGEVTARAFGKLLESSDEDALIDLATTRVDLASHDARGTTALHFAAAAAKPSVVKALLGRGADASAEDSRGRKPYESARSAWRKHPREAGEIFALLDQAGGGEKKKEEPPPPPDWVVGTKVTHSKFGDGVIEAITGLGEETKLKIKFGKKNEKTLLAKFVTKHA